MFVATTLAVSLALSPVTTAMGTQPLLQGTRSYIGTQTYAWMAPAPAANCPKLEVRAAVQIDTAALTDDAAGVGTRMRGKVEQAVQSFDVLLGDDVAKLPVIVIKVAPIPNDEGFSFTVDINHDTHKPIKDGSSFGECKLCTESELLEKVAGSTRALMPKLRGYITDFNNQPCGAPPAECEADAQCKDPNRPVCHRTEKRCVADLRGGCSSDADCAKSPVGPFCAPESHKCVASLEQPQAGMNGKQKAGIGLMIAGALGAGIGVGLVVNKPKVPDPMVAWETRETQKPGFAVLAVGGAALITGVVLFVLGRRQASKKLSQFAPMVPTGSLTGQGAGAGVYGLSWSGRF